MCIGRGALRFEMGAQLRPDYRYVSRFIKETAGDADPVPVTCLTATARPEVVRDVP